MTDFVTSDVRDGIPRASRPFESPMTLAVRNSRVTVAPDTSLRPAGADEAEADTAQAVAADPSVIDAERHPLYGHGVQHVSKAEAEKRWRERIEPAAREAAQRYVDGVRDPESAEHVRQSRLSRWQEQR